MNAAPRPRVRHHVLPFRALTPRQQAEHLVACHGYDASYFTNRHGGRLFADDELVKLAWTGDYAIADARDDGSPLPFPTTRDIDHDDDHTPGLTHGWDDGFGGGIPHTHTKGMPDECYDAAGQFLPRGRCDTCGAPCDDEVGECTRDADHAVAIDVTVAR